MASLTYYVDKIKFQLTGGILESELSDDSYSKIIDIALQELNRFYDSTRLITVSASSCIDLNKIETENNIKINSVSNIFRTEPNGTTTGSTRTMDPIYLSQWNFAGFGGLGSNKWAYNYMAYNTMNQIANTLSTDLDFREDKSSRKLYVNYSTNQATNLTIEYVPKLQKTDDVVGDYWVDILSKLALAHAKITLGRIRTRYTQDNAQWKQDGDTLLDEGNNELKELRERLANQTNLIYPLD